MRRRHNWLLFCGLALIGAGLCLILATTVLQIVWQKQADALVKKIESVLPERSVGVAEPVTDPRMPALSIQGEDFIGLVEIPAYGVKLPLHAQWKRLKMEQYPCRLDGSVYTDDLILGGSAAQLACLRQIGHGDVVTVTDMQGAVYTYRVTKIRRGDNARLDTIRDETARLVIFMRDRYTMEYILVSCS